MTTKMVPTLKFSDAYEELCFYEKVSFFHLFESDVKKLIEEEKDIDTPIPLICNNNYNQRLLTTLLYAAVTNNEKNLVDYLLEHNADPNQPVGDHNACTPLHNAIRRRRSLSIVKKLVAHGADLEQPIGHDQKTPLDLAVQTGDYHVIKILVDGGVEVRNVFKNTVQIHWVLGDNFHHIVTLLWENGAKLWNYESPMEYYSAMLLEAAWTLRTHTVEKLIKMDVDIFPYYVDNDGRTYPMLYQVVLNFRARPLELLLLYHKFTVDSINGVLDDKSSLLHVAVQKEFDWEYDAYDPDHSHDSDIRVVKHLLNAGIDVNIKDCCDKLAIDYENFNKRELVMEIKKHIIRLMVLGFQVDERNSWAVQGPELDDLRKECQEEVQKMKNSMILHSNLSYFRLFQIAEHKLAVYLKNTDAKHLQYLLDCQFLANNGEIYSKEFPQYGGMIYYKLVKIRPRIRVLRKAQENIEEIFRCYLPSNFLDMIYGYLSYDQLKVLAEEKYEEKLVRSRWDD